MELRSCTNCGLVVDYEYLGKEKEMSNTWRNPKCKKCPLCGYAIMENSSDDYYEDYRVTEPFDQIKEEQ